MFWLLTAGGIVAGALLGRAGLRRFWRRRAAEAPVESPIGFAARAKDRVGNWLLATSATFLLLPDLLAGLLSDYPGWGAFFLFMLWRSVVLFGIGTLALGALVTSRRSRRLAREGAITVTTKLPSGTGWRLRRDFKLDDFPQTWDGLLSYDHDLSRRLVSYQHDLELLANRPAMADYSNPQTRAAVSAMTECDRLRQHTPPLTRDVITTEYGQAVARFAVALRTAETSASNAARSGLGVEERERLAEAGRIIAFIAENATTDADRDRAYERVRELLVSPTATTSEPKSTARQHPWLDVHQRADGR